MMVEEIETKETEEKKKKRKRKTRFEKEAAKLRKEKANLQKELAQIRAGYNAVEESAEAKEEIKPAKPKVKKRATKRLVFLTLAGILLGFGVLFLTIYFFTQNMFFGAPGVLCGFAGAMLGYYFWNQEDDLVNVQIGKAPVKDANCLNIYADHIAFEVYHPKNGEEQPDYMQMLCRNDKKRYWVQIDKDSILDKFTLPDLIYYDPTVFAEKVLSLPAHKRIFTRREKLGQHIKTALLVLTIIILWILILTTTT